jgi:hypothetical protein
MLSTLLLSARVHRRSVLRAPEVLAAVAISPKPALSNATREIALLSIFVAGTAYYDADQAHAALTQGEDLILRRQPDNRFDSKAIEVFTRNGSKLGYVPRSDNAVLSALMDDGRRLRARITALHPSRCRDIGLAVALVERA